MDILTYTRVNNKIDRKEYIIKMSTSDFISIIAIFGSLFSLYITDQNKKKIQQNEFNFSKRKIWFEKQNEIIDKSIEKIIDMHQFTNEIITYAELKESILINQEDRVCREIQERVENIIINNRYLISHKHYFNKNIEKNIDMILTLSNEISVQLNEKVRNNEKINELEIKKFRTDLYKIPTYIQKITKEIREEYLNI